MTKKDNGSNTKIAVMAEQINTINTNVNEIKERLEKDYVTVDKLKLYTDRVERMEKVVYGLVAIVLTAFVLALIKLVVL